MIYPDYIKLSTDLQQLISSDQAWHYSIVPKKKSDSVLEFFIDEESYNDSIKDELEILFAHQIVLETYPSAIISKTLSKYYRKIETGRNAKRIEFINDSSDDFLTNIIWEAKLIKCSDIHLEKYESKCRIRMRIDGKLIERYVIKDHEYPAIINKIKIKANLDIAEKRLPQDGRIFFEKGEEQFDIRVSVLPTLYGEKVVLRLLSKDATQIDIKELGFSKTQIENYLEGIKKPFGIILISGPTGSGKTTTLYATLKILNNEISNILTIEDPIEYTLEGINQVQLKESIGLTFSKALRTFLRQDPDIIMLGEIRDNETAQMAIRSALTGHLVLSTIHTNSAWGIVSRLVDMGVPSFLLASTLSLAVAQRLVRILCPNCKVQKDFDDKLFPSNYKYHKEIKKHFGAVGCEHCFYTGFYGRKAVYEVITIDNNLAESIKNENFQVSDVLKEKGVKLLADSAIELFERGETTIEEIYSILMTKTSE